MTIVHGTVILHLTQVSLVHFAVILDRAWNFTCGSKHLLVASLSVITWFLKFFYTTSAAEVLFSFSEHVAFASLGLSIRLEKIVDLKLSLSVINVTILTVLFAEACLQSF